MLCAHLHLKSRRTWEMWITMTQGSTMAAELISYQELLLTSHMLLRLSTSTWQMPPQSGHIKSNQPKLTHHTGLVKLDTYSTLELTSSVITAMLTMTETDYKLIKVSALFWVFFLAISVVEVTHHPNHLWLFICAYHSVVDSHPNQLVVLTFAYFANSLWLNLYLCCIKTPVVYIIINI